MIFDSPYDYAILLWVAILILGGFWGYLMDRQPRNSVLCGILAVTIAAMYGTAVYLGRLGM